MKKNPFFDKNENENVIERGAREDEEPGDKTRLLTLVEAPKIEYERKGETGEDREEKLSSLQEGYDPLNLAPMPDRGSPSNKAELSNRVEEHEHSSLQEGYHPPSTQEATKLNTPTPELGGTKQSLLTLYLRKTQQKISTFPPTDACSTIQNSTQEGIYNHNPNQNFSPPPQKLAVPGDPKKGKKSSKMKPRKHDITSSCLKVTNFFTKKAVKENPLPDKSET